MNIDKLLKIELGELVYFLMEVKGIEYGEAENLLPAHIFEGGRIGQSTTETEWNKEIIQYLKDHNIESIAVYQDC
ncbi:hypothetical protein DRO61_04920 [Candidatus Bathyarchaeota archaeon]|nr:MAG: hypothetical protein DRO61_04920 [Candidatus Bathyarchaeota archaeon]